MSFWRGETLARKLPVLVKPFNPSAIDCAAYTLHIGTEIYVSPDQRIPEVSQHTKVTLGEDQGFVIPAGQFAFLLSDEVVRVPEDAMAFLSIKARIKFSGLINISGFHVDPGYHGRLVFSVLNAGPKPLHLQQGQALFLLWYADLDGKTSMRKTTKGFDRLDTQLINGISGEIFSLQSLSNQHKELKSRLEQRQNEQAETIASLKSQFKVFWSIIVPEYLC